MVKVKRKHPKAPKTPGSSNWDKLRATIETDDKKRMGKRKRKTKALELSTPTGRSPSLLLVPTALPSAPSANCVLHDKISDNITHRLALDCEMVGSGKEGVDNQLARVSIVNVYGEAVYDKIVLPREKVTDYRSHITGLDRLIIADKGVKFKIVQEEVAAMVKDRIVIGHDIKHDFQVLGFSHPKHLIRDTSKYKPFKALSAGNTPSLKKLCRELLKTDIHAAVHDSVEDARCTLQLYRRCRTAWERGLKKRRRKDEKGAGEEEEDSEGHTLDD